MAVKKQMLFAIVCCLCFLSGCSRTDDSEKRQVLYRVVDRIDVSCYRSGTVQHFSYQTPQKMQLILSYLRQLEYRGKADTDPERICGDSYQITLTASDGTACRYRQRADRYLSRDGHPWENIDPDQARRLYPLLQAMPSDTA